MEKDLKRYTFALRHFSLLAGTFLLAVVAVCNATATTGELPLLPEPRHEKVGQLVSDIIEKSHYRHASIDDKFSSAVLDSYIEAMDSNKLFFLQSDIDNFEQYRDRIDNMVRDESLLPVFDMFNTFLQRYRDRWQFALTQLDTAPDFTLNEEFEFDRENAAWAKSPAELDKLWRLRVKQDALNLALTDKPWDESREILRKRYERLIKRQEQLNSDDVFEIFMNSLAHTLDPHSSYLSPRRSEEYRIKMSLSYFGIGASLQIDEDYVMVSGIIPGGPAAIDGELKAKDRITAVGQGLDGEMVDVIGWRLDDVVELIRGPAETVVRLQIMPAGALPGGPDNVINLTRDKVKLEEQAAKSEIVTVPRDGRDWKIGVINVPSFYRDFRALSSGDQDYKSTTKDVHRLISELEEEGIDGLVMDLRGNGGGALPEATALSGLFIDNGPVVQLRNSNGRILRLDDPDPVPRVAYHGPLAVLVDRFSASASEIFAAAIQDYARGVIIGQQTFGKGSVQNLYSLDQYLRKSDDNGYGQLTLTTGKFYRVTGESTQHKGVVPDISLPSAIDVHDFGESSSKTALPWDTIDTTMFKAGTPLNATISSLMANYTERSKSDANYQFLVQGIEEIDEMRSKKSVSLNIDKRRKEREEAQARQLSRENARRAALKLPELKSMEEFEDSEAPDIYLQEASAVVTDMAQMREVKPRDAQAAAVTR